jgi:mannose-6-phosphate isomerase-like protein (cupin superfamily)
VNRGAARASVVAALVLALAAGCRSQRTPKALPAPPVAKSEPVLTGAVALQPYLDAYPLSDGDTRMDLVAATARRSMHLIQARVPLPRQSHPQRTETMYVLTGSGTCYVGDHSYPLAPGSTFRIRPGVPLSLHPDEGTTLVAVAWFEPPMTADDDGVIVP